MPGCSRQLMITCGSMNDFNCIIIIFDSTHQALAGEKALKEAGIRHAVVNTPREFSASCGISLRVELGLQKKVQSILSAKQISYARIEPYRSRWMKD